MKKLFCFLCIIISMQAFGQNVQEEIGDKIKYFVSGHFDDTTKTFNGKETIIFKNTFKDTLQAIYIRLDANAYSSDTTKYSDALVATNQTDFYFSSKNEKGYISGLKFIVVNSELEIASINTISNELLKLDLSSALKRGDSLQLETLVNIQLPYNFNNNGFANSSIYFQNWIPKIAGYFNGNWSIVPFENRGKVYTNASNYDFQLTGLYKYKLFYGGEILNENASSLQFSGTNSDIIAISKPNITQFEKNNITIHFIQIGQHLSSIKMKELSDSAFSFIATLKNNYGSVSLKNINIYANLFTDNYSEKDKIYIKFPDKNWKINVEKQIAQLYVLDKLNVDVQGYPYLSNGLAQYYFEKNSKEKVRKFPFSNLPNDNNWLGLYQLANTKQLQSYRLSTDQYNSANFPISPEYGFTKKIENDSVLMNSVSSMLNSKELNGSLVFNQQYTDSFYTPNTKKSYRTAFLFNLKHTDKYKYLSIAPSIGYNNYDKFMLGAFIHNYQLPLNKFDFLVAPMYSFTSKKLNGAARLEYNIWNPKDHWKFGISGVRYSIDELNQPEYERLFQSMYRITPRVDYVKYLSDTKVLHFFVRDLIINHQEYRFNYNSGDNSYSAFNENFHSNIAEANISLDDHRNLYPYATNLDIMQVKNILRLSWTGKYFFNYNSKGEGISTRIFAGKIFYLKSQTNAVQVNNAPYGFYMNGASGREDFLYSDYFIGRTESSGWMSQQIIERDGFFKVKPPGISSSNFGFSDDWLSSLNVVADIPQNWNPFQVLPFKVPLKVFVDVGTYSELWSGKNDSEKLLYDAGLQLSLFKSLVNIYVPIIYSQEYKDIYNSVYPKNKFLRTISFSINLNAFNYKKYL